MAMPTSGVPGLSGPSPRLRPRPYWWLPTLSDSSLSSVCARRELRALLLWRCVGRGREGEEDEDRREDEEEGAEEGGGAGTDSRPLRGWQGGEATGVGERREGEGEEAEDACGALLCVGTGAWCGALLLWCMCICCTLWRGWLLLLWLRLEASGADSAWRRLGLGGAKGEEGEEAQGRDMVLLKSGGEAMLGAGLDTQGEGEWELDRLAVKEEEEAEKAEKEEVVEVRGGAGTAANSPRPLSGLMMRGMSALERRAAGSILSSPHTKAKSSSEQRWRSADSRLPHVWYSCRLKRCGSSSRSSCER